MSTTPKKWSYDDFLKSNTTLEAKVADLEAKVKKLRIESAQNRMALSKIQSSIRDNLDANPFPLTEPSSPLDDKTVPY